MIIFLNSSSKQATTSFPIGCLQEVLVPTGCLQDPLLYYKNQGESLGTGLEGGTKLGKGR